MINKIFKIVSSILYLYLIFIVLGSFTIYAFKNIGISIVLLIITIVYFAILLPYIILDSIALHKKLNLPLIFDNNMTFELDKKTGLELIYVLTDDDRYICNTNNTDINSNFIRKSEIKMSYLGKMFDLHDTNVKFSLVDGNYLVKIELTFSIISVDHSAILHLTKIELDELLSKITT